MTTRPLARLDGVLAADAPRAVLLRRGPSKLVLAIGWDTARDAFEIGQWFKGRIPPRTAALSPDGALLAYAAERVEIHQVDHRLRDVPAGSAGHEKRARQGPMAWVAVSRPPWLTALAMWPDAMSASWAGPRRLHLVGPSRLMPGYDVPADLEVVNIVDVVAGLIPVPAPLPAPAPRRHAIEVAWSEPPDSGLAAAVRGDERAPIEDAGWADVDPIHGDLVFARGHRLYRARIDAGRPLDRAIAEARLLADFGPLQFEPREAPLEATVWPPGWAI